MELMTPHAGTIFWTAITFALLAFVLYKIAWNPILTLLEERERRIKESLETAERARAESQQRQQEHEALIDEAKQQAHEIIAASRHQGEQLRDEFLKKSQAESDKMVERAKHEIQASRDKVLEEMRDLAVELSMDATRKLIGRTLTDEEHKRIIQQSIQDMEHLN